MRQEFLIVRNTDPDEMSEPDEPLKKTGDVADVEVLFDGVFTQNEDRMGSQFALNTWKVPQYASDYDSPDIFIFAGTSFLIFHFLLMLHGREIRTEYAASSYPSVFMMRLPLMELSRHMHFLLICQILYGSFLHLPEGWPLQTDESLINLC